MGIQRYDIESQSGRDCLHLARDDGDYVLFADHEQVVADLRAELAAKSKDAARWEWLKARMLSADFKADDYVGLTFELPAGSRVSANADATIDAAMGEGNGR